MWEQGCAHYAAGRWTAAARAFNGIDVAAMTACGSSAAPALALEAALEVNGILCARRGAAAALGSSSSSSSGADDESSSSSSAGSAGGVAGAARLAIRLETACERLAPLFRDEGRAAPRRSLSSLHASVAIYLRAAASAAAAHLHANDVCRASALCDRACGTVASLPRRPESELVDGVVSSPDGTHPLVAYALRQRLESIVGTIRWCAPSGAATSAAVAFALIVSAVAARSGRTSEGIALLQHIDRSLSITVAGTVAVRGSSPRPAKRRRGLSHHRGESIERIARLRSATRVALAALYAALEQDVAARATLHQHLGLPTIATRGASVESSAAAAAAAHVFAPVAGAPRDGLLLLAWLENERGCTAEATQLLLHTARTDPRERHRSAALNSAGCVEMAVGRIPEAIALWHRAAQQCHPRIHAHALFNTARAYRHLHRTTLLNRRRGSSLYGGADPREAGLSGELLALLQREMVSNAAVCDLPTPRLLSLQHAVEIRASVRAAAEGTRAVAAACVARVTTVATVVPVVVTFEAALAAQANQNWGRCASLLSDVYAMLYPSGDAAATSVEDANTNAREAKRNLRQVGASIIRVHRLLAFALLQTNEWERCAAVCRRYEETESVAKDVPLLIYAADASICLERPREALKLLERALGALSEAADTWSGARDVDDAKLMARENSHRLVRQQILNNMALAKACVSNMETSKSSPSPVELLQDAQAQAQAWTEAQTAMVVPGARTASVAAPRRTPLESAQGLAVAFNLALALRRTGQCVDASATWLECRGIDTSRAPVYYTALREAATRELSDVKLLRDATLRTGSAGGGLEARDAPRAPRDAGLLDRVEDHVNPAVEGYNAVPDAQILRLDSIVLEQWAEYTSNDANRENVVRLQRYLSSVMQRAEGQRS